jgi:hypothetical protein
MIVECIGKKPLISFPDKVIQRDYNVTVGRLYLVYGLQVNEDRSIYIEHLPDSGNLSEAPLELFKVKDSKISRNWQVKVWEDGSLTMWPALFYKEYFHDDLSEGIEENVELFIELKKLLEEEQDFKQMSYNG